MQTTVGWILSSLGAIILCSSAANATVVLYNQDFESPAAFVNDGGDVNINNSINTLYGNQPPGFTFAQANTVETLLITGTQAFGTGYSDPAGTGGNYAIGMLSSFQNDLLGLSFNVGTNDFLNVGVDISHIDLSVFSGPFGPDPGEAPLFRFTLYDNPSGATGLGSGTILDFLDATGNSSNRSVFDWTNEVLPLDATGNTNGNVILRIDLLSGNYGSFDNLIIAASDDPGDIGDGNGDENGDGNEPEPTALALICLGLAGIGYRRRQLEKA